MNFIGCATVPKKEVVPSYHINGTTYYPLLTLCDRRNIDWDYDTFTRTCVLKKLAHRISLRVGETLVLVDGEPFYLAHPIDIFQGTVVVPSKFKTQILDFLFKEPITVEKKDDAFLKIKRIVIDAGHGGRDPGAIGRTGIREKQINLDIARRLGRILSSKGADVVMTRTRDNFIPLPERTEIANNSGAGLFISIHSNANRVKSLNGLEVYYISGQVNDCSRALATAKKAKLNLEEDCFAERSQNLEAILWDMIYTDNRAESIELSHNICRAINSNLGLKVIGLKGAGFQVLKDTHMPAILIEVGFLSNPDEERKLKNSYYRQKLAEALAEGIQQYAEGISFISVAKK